MLEEIVTVVDAGARTVLLLVKRLNHTVAYLPFHVLRSILFLDLFIHLDQVLLPLLFLILLHKLLQHLLSSLFALLSDIFLDQFVDTVELLLS